MKEYVEEEATRNLRPLVDKLFGELTVLGFLSVMTFAITKAGWFSALSSIFFGDTGELLEIFEFVHFTIFFIMTFFVIQVLILVSAATETEQKWIELDKAARDPSLFDEWERQTELFCDSFRTQRRRSFHKAREVTDLLPLLRDRSAQDREDRLLFKALRDEFILERAPHYPFHPSPEEKRVSADFNFGRYLGINQGSLLGQVVEVSIITWAFFAFLTIVYYGYVILVNENVSVSTTSIVALLLSVTYFFLIIFIQTLAWSWVAMGWFVYLLNVVFERHLLYVRKMFLKKEYFLIDRGDSQDHQKSYLDNSESTRFDTDAIRYTDSSNDSLPLWTDIDIDEFHHKGRSWIAKHLIGGKVSRHQAIYWLDRKGPKFYLLILQSNLLFLGIYSAMNFLGFCQYMYKEEPILIFLVYIILAATPLLANMLTKQHTVAILSQVCCMGAYRRPNVVSDVLREDKTARIVRAFIIIYKMRRFAMNADTAGYDRAAAATRRMQFDKVELKEVGKTIDSFDKNGDGTIDYSEFESLMKNLGAELSEDNLKRIINLLDEDGDGTVSREEFINWYAENAGDDDLSDSERAHFLFTMFDRDDAGEITIEEFKRKLDAFNVGFSIDEVGAIVNELDEDNSGTIGLHEFENLLYKYYPKELRSGSSVDNSRKSNSSHHH
jgi:calmodulin